jgi:hypothetical protein
MDERHRRADERGHELRQRAAVGRERRLGRDEGRLVDGDEVLVGVQQASPLERAGRLGGALAIASGAGGTTVRLEVPRG